MEDLDEEMMEYEGFDELPKMFKCYFKVWGENSSKQKELIFEDEEYHIIAINVQDAIEKITADHLHIEVNHQIGSKLEHSVSTEVNIYEIQMLGPITAVTNTSLKQFAKHYKAPYLMPDPENDDDEE